jgi:hypothetical protein
VLVVVDLWLMLWLVLVCWCESAVPCHWFGGDGGVVVVVVMVVLWLVVVELWFMAVAWSLPPMPAVRL